MFDYEKYMINYRVMVAHFDFFGTSSENSRPWRVHHHERNITKLPVEWILHQVKLTRYDSTHTDVVLDWVLKT